MTFFVPSVCTSGEAHSRFNVKRSSDTLRLLLYGRMKSSHEKDDLYMMGGGGKTNHVLAINLDSYLPAAAKDLPKTPSSRHVVAIVARSDRGGIAVS